MTVHDVMKVIETWSENEKTVLTLHLLNTLRSDQLSPSERRMIFESMTLDLGSLSQTYSDERKNWYEDDAP